MIEIVHRALREHHVAGRVDVAGHAPGDLGQVLNVHVVVDHGLWSLVSISSPHPPTVACMTLRGVPRVLLPDRDDHQVMGNIPSAGMETSTTSGSVSCIAGRSTRTPAVPMK